MAQSKNITKKIKIALVDALVFPVFSYACETWVIQASDRKRIDAFEMWVWRRLLRIPWTARRTNASVLNEIKPTQRLSSVTYSRILKLFGHISRHDTMERFVVQGQLEGKRKRRRSPTRWTELISKLTKSTLEKACRQANDRDKCRDIVKRAVRNIPDTWSRPPHIGHDVGLRERVAQRKHIPGGHSFKLENSQNNGQPLHMWYRDGTRVIHVPPWCCLYNLGSFMCSVATEGSTISLFLMQFGKWTILVPFPLKNIF